MRKYALAILIGVIGAFVGSYLTYYLSPEKAQVLITQSLKEITNPQEAKSDNRLYHVLIQYYPSTQVVAESAKLKLELAGFSVLYFAKLRQDQLLPRKSKIIYYSVASKKKSMEIREIFQESGFNVPISRSPYFGDPKSEFKIFINLF